MAGGPGGLAPLQTERPQSLAEPQTPPSQTPQSPRHGSMAPEPQSPGTPLDLSAGTHTHTLDTHTRHTIHTLDTHTIHTDMQHTPIQYRV